MTRLKMIPQNVTIGTLASFICLLMAGFVHAEVAAGARQVTFGAHQPSITIAPARIIAIPEATNPHRRAPFRVDNNAPSLWIDGKLIVFHSWENIWRAGGNSLDSLSGDEMTRFVNPKLNYLWFWLESAFRPDGRTVYGYYHQEVPNICPPRKGVVAPGYPVIAVIGAVRSRDEGKSWEDLGTILGGNDSEMKCESGSPWFAGGTGDFNASVDHDGKYYYFYFANYTPEVGEQGLSVARLAASDLDIPVGKVQRWYQGAWREPGLGGHATPIWPATVDIYRPNGQIFWGPVIHFNTYLGKYVMIVNQTQDASWATEGIYMSFSDDVGNPQSWSPPIKIMDRAEAMRGDASKPRWNGWYASLAGTGPGETDKQASQKARLFIDGVSRWEISFHKP